MNMQEAYEQIRAWLTRPEARISVNGDGGTCMYQTYDGKQKCAVGCLLSDTTLKKYGGWVGDARDLIQDMLLTGTEDPILDLISSDMRQAVSKDFQMIEEDDQDIGLEFLLSCQQAHDAQSYWRDDGFNVAILDGIATDFGLKVVTT